jgi:hypothetical protein
LGTAVTLSVTHPTPVYAIEIPDTDGDGVVDTEDNCPVDHNPFQENNDGDAEGDVCDPDDDNDGVADANDDRPLSSPQWLFGDTDGDSLLDSDEDVLGTSSNTPDTDGDGLDDGSEVALGADPLETDTDLDGLTDGEEYGRHTKPTLADTDSDGSSDGNEVNVCNTDPLDPDTDSDGIPDGSDECPLVLGSPIQGGAATVADTGPSGGDNTAGPSYGPENVHTAGDGWAAEASPVLLVLMVTVAGFVTLTVFRQQPFTLMAPRIWTVGWSGRLLVAVWAIISVLMLTITTRDLVRAIPNCCTAGQPTIPHEHTNIVSPGFPGFAIGPLVIIPPGTVRLGRPTIADVIPEISGGPAGNPATAPDTHAHQHRDSDNFTDAARPMRWSYAIAPMRAAIWDNQQRRIDPAAPPVDIGHGFIDENGYGFHPPGPTQVTWHFDAAVGPGCPAMPAAMQANVRAAFAAWNNINAGAGVRTLTTGIEFVEVAAGGQVEIRWQNIAALGSTMMLFGALPATVTFDCNPVGATWEFGAPADAGAAEYHFLSTALHEIGHLLDLHDQPFPADVTDVMIGNRNTGCAGAGAGPCFIAVDADSEHGARDMYTIPTPDFGDAPATYPTLLLAACAGGVDNDMDGSVNDGCPAVGAAEVGPACANALDNDGDGRVNDGCPAVGVAEADNGARAPTLAFEWLGPRPGTGNSTTTREVDADRVVPHDGMIRLDEFDDGCKLENVAPGGMAKVTYTISVRDRGAPRYAAANARLYVAIWVDWNQDGDWNPGELLDLDLGPRFVHTDNPSGWAAGVTTMTYVRNVPVPAAAKPGPTWMRCRLVYGREPGANPGAHVYLEGNTGDEGLVPLPDSPDNGGEIEDHLAPQCPEDSDAALTRAMDPEGNDAALTDGLPTHLTLQAAMNAAANGEVIGFYGRSKENVTIGGNKSLTITQCTVAQITAGDATKPVVDITTTGKLLIIGLDTVGGTVGWRVGTNGHELRGVRATGASQFGILVVGNNNSVSYNSVDNSAVGIRVEGDFNDLRGGTVAHNTGDGVQLAAAANNNTFRTANVRNNGGNGILVEGLSNTVRDNGRVDNNALNGILVTGSSNTILNNATGSDSTKGNGQDGIKVMNDNNLLDSNKVNANAGDGFDISGGTVGGPNKLKNNQSNQSSAGGTKENTGAEYRFLNLVKNDGGGNKADTIRVPKNTSPTKCPSTTNPPQFPTPGATVNYTLAATCE